MTRIIGFLIGLMILGQLSSTACSVFNITLPDGRTLVGRNLDWRASSTGRVDFLPRGVGRYGAMLFFIDDDIWPQGGMNDQGLVLGMTATPYLQITPDPEKLPMELDFWENLFQTCASLEDVLSYLERFDLSSMPGYFERGQMLWTDRSGDSAIVEGEMIYRKDGDVQTITNFLHSHPELGGYPCGRYDLINDMLAVPANEITDAYFLSIIEAAHGTIWGGYTVYSNFFDILVGEVTVFYRGNFENGITFNLDQELANGATRYDFETIFAEGKPEFNDHQFYVSDVRSGDDVETFVGIVNGGSQPQYVDIWGYSDTGEELGHLMQVAPVPSGGRMWLNMADAFPQTHENIRWVRVDGSREMTVFAEIRDGDSHAAYWAAAGLTDHALAPHIAKDTDQFQTILASVNGRDNGIGTVLMPRPTGSIQSVSEHGVPFAQARHDVLDYWDDVSDINWVELAAEDRGFAAMESFSYIDGHARTAALGLDDLAGKILRFLHVAADTQLFWTGMVYVNVGDGPANIREIAYDAAGQVLSSRTLELDRHNKVTLLVDADDSELVPAGTSWLQVESDQNLVGYELFGSARGTDDDTFAGLQGNYGQAPTLDYPKLATSEAEWSGYVAVNVGTEPADITFHVMDDGGNELAQTIVSNVAPNQKITRLGSDLSDAFSGVSKWFWVRATTSGSQWAGFVLWGDHGGPMRQHLCAIKARLRN